eukprot:RCo005003
MEKLLLDANFRFEEKLQAAKEGQPVNVAAYSATDKSFNFRSQGQYNAQLQQDKHFGEMVRDIEKYTSPEFIMRGDAGKRLYGLLAGLLRGVLREAIAGVDPGQRKINIEKCWNFYKDKKKQLLDWKLDRKATTPAEGEEPDEAARESPPPGTPDQPGKPLPSVLVKTTVGGSVAATHFPLEDFNVDRLDYNRLKDRIKVPNLNYMQQEDDQQRATGITKKLQLYKKRNLRRALQLRQGGAGSEVSSPLGDRPSSPPATAPAASSSVRVVYKNRARGDLLAMPILPHSSAFHAASAKPDSGPHLRPDFADTLHEVHKVWVQRRAQEAEEKLEEMEFKDTISMWSHNQARIEEECNRRQESYQMSSQTGKTCHKILRRPTPAASQERAARPGVVEDIPALMLSPASGAEPPGVRQDGSNYPPSLSASMLSGSGMSGSLMGGSLSASVASYASSAVASAVSGKKAVSILDPSMQRPHTVPAEAAGGAAALTRPRTLGPIHHSLSPYDYLEGTRERSNMRLLLSEPPPSLKTPDQAPMKGLKHTHPNALRSTSLLNASMDVRSSLATIFAPSMYASVGRILKDGGDADDEEEEAGKKKKPAASADKKKKKGEAAPKKSFVRRGKPDPQTLELLLPVLSIEQEVPSLHRMQQMSLVERVREACARTGLSVRTSAIEQGILTPEDRPYEECITNLPPPEFGLVRDFTKKREKKGKAKKGKGK